MKTTETVRWTVLSAVLVAASGPTGVTASESAAVGVREAPTAVNHEFYGRTPNFITECPTIPTAAYKTLNISLTKMPYTASGFPNIVVVEDTGEMVGGGDINLAAVAKSFYRGFADDRDFLFVFATTKDQVSANYNAYYRSLRNTTSGIGRSPTDDWTKGYGSSGKLLGVANMNTVYKWTNFLLPIADMWPLGVITHEIGHQWIAYVKVPKGSVTTDPNSARRSHWDPLTHTEASIMYGNDWKQLTPEFKNPFTGKTVPATFASVGIPGGFSALDKYLMGVHGKEKVKGFFRIEASSKNILAHYAVPGNTAAGKRINFTVADIIKSNGARVPDYKSAQRSFKAAFVIIAQKGKTPATDELKAVEYFRKRIPEHFQEATDGRFSISTTLKKK